MVNPRGTASALAGPRRQLSGCWVANSNFTLQSGRLGKLAGLRILDVEEIKAVPYVALSHPFVERLIGTVRREFLDQILFWNVTDLQWKLDSFRDYYNRQRIHKSRNGRPPAETAKDDAAADRFGWQRCCHGLYELPIEV